MKNYGLIIPPIEAEDLVLGGSKSLGGQVLVPDGQWDAWLPEPEIQNLNCIEPSACVSFSLTNIVEIMERQEFNKTSNYSDRFLATASGTTRNGNSLKTVAQTLKNKGCAEEKDLPFDASITTFEKFYAPIQERIYALALVFKAEFAFGYEYVNPTPDALMEALKYSPLQFTVYAWVQDADGLYYRPTGLQDGHATVCYGYKKNYYWLIYDSYDSSGVVLKKLRWDALPQQCQRVTLHRNVVVETAWTRFVAQLRALFGL